MPTRFWKLRPVEEDEWIVDTKNRLSEMMKRMRGVEKGNVWPTVRAIEPWQEPFPVECASAGPYYDMASSATSSIVVSNAFKRVIEKLGPDAVQFLPLQMTYRRKPLPCGQYWAGNVLNAYDCVDFEASGCKPGRFRDCYHHLGDTDLVIIDAKVPEDASIFQLHMLLNRWIITDRLKRAMQAARLTGIQYLKP